MFLTLQSRLARDQRGAALAAVLGVMALGMIITALIATSLVSAFKFSSASRAGVQSQGAADAGIAAARAGLYVTGNCAAQPTPGTYSASGDLTYTAVVQYDAGAGWQSGCPIAGTSHIRIVSTGAASAPGVVGASFADIAEVEAVLKYLSPGVHPSGVAMYLHGGGVVEANSSLDLSESGEAGLLVKNGDLFCDKNNTVINGSVVVNGNLTFAKKCSVNGSAWVAGAAALGSGSVSDDLNAASVTPNPPGSKVGGTYTQGGAVPPIPEWVDLDYSPTDWVDETGAPFEVRNLTSCTLSSGNLGGTIPGAPVVINALGCPSGPTAGNNTTVKLTSDVVIYANRFNFESINSFTFTSSTTAGHRLWFVTPDNVVNGVPDCQPGQGSFSVKNGFAINEPIDAMLYTPCAFEGKNGFTWRGQLYAGTYSHLKNNPSFTYVPVGIAGADLTNGGHVPVITHPEPGSVVSMRNIAGG